MKMTDNDVDSVEQERLSVESTSLERTLRALRTLSAGFRTLSRAKDESALLRDMCTAIVAKGGYRRAGVAFAEQDTEKSIRWVNCVGMIDGTAVLLDLDWINKSNLTYADTPLGQSTVGIAIRTGLPCVRRDIINDPLYSSEDFSIFRERAIGDNYASLSAFPLISDDQVIGSLFIAAGEVDAFDNDELCLLGQMADDLAFGISGLRMRERHRQAEATIHRLAFFDSMTGLPNRTKQLENIAEYLEGAGGSVSPISLIHLNVAQFGDVCNVFGQRVGDQLIIEVARRLRSGLVINFKLARVSESIFSIIVSAEEEIDIVTFAGQLVRELNDPIEAADIIIDPGIHASIATISEDSKDAETLFRRANSALFYGERVSDGVKSFECGKTAEQVSRLSLMGDLRLALKRNELRVFCQPKVDMRTNQVVGAEALIRWEHPMLGMVPPAYFIKVAEQSGIIVELTRWILDVCFSWISKWQDEGVTETLAINLSAHDLLSSSIVSDISRIMAKWNICPRSVEFEVTESALIEDPQIALEVLTRLKELGVQLLLDDFGTGYSSLSY
jgi:diguanylate cyclase (GGDEF)-like protein